MAGRAHAGKMQGILSQQGRGRGGGGCWQHRWPSRAHKARPRTRGQTDSEMPSMVMNDLRLLPLKDTKHSQARRHHYSKYLFGNLKR